MKKLTALLLSALMLIAPLFTLSVAAAPVSDTIGNYFTDVPDNAWYTEGVLYCYKFGYMAGVGDAIFNPGGKCTRATFATVLYNISLAKDNYTKMSFTDVKAGSWYANPVEWAYQNGFTSGIGKGMFGPNNVLTRQELVTLLYKYHQSIYTDIAVTGNYAAFADAKNVATWAKDAINWAIGEKIISGTGNNMLSPKGEVTRSQLAQILKSYLKNYGIVWGSEEVVSVHSCTKDGVSIFTSEDGSVTQKVTYKAWHKYIKGEVVQKYDCINGEKSRYRCEFCGATKTDISRKGSGKHNWNSGVVTANPSLTSEGEKLFTCKTCGGTYTSKIPKVILNSALVGFWKSSNYADTYGNIYSNSNILTMSITASGNVAIDQSNAESNLYYLIKFVEYSNGNEVYSLLDSYGELDSYLIYDSNYGTLILWDSKSYFIFQK